jgi:hypothetical protein
MIMIDDREFVDTLFGIVGRKETPSVSSVYVLPYHGSAGTVGVVLTVAGTPPHATLLVPLGGSYNCYSGWALHVSSNLGAATTPPSLPGSNAIGW